MRSFLSRGKFAWCLAPGGASGVRTRPAPARRNLGGAKCRWPDACQGRSRRRRWPKASLYKGLASDDDRRPRRLHPSLAASFAPPTRMRTKAAARRRAERLRRGAHGHARPLSRGDFRLTTRLVPRVGWRPLSGGFSTDDEARLSWGWRLTMMSGARGAAIGSARRKSRGELAAGAQ